MRPMLADDYVEEKLVFPLGAQPKIDGVRGLNMLGNLTGRSLKFHKNKHTTKFYSHSSLVGLDGELAAESETNPDLCRITSSALSTINGEPYTLWWLFDYVTPQTIQLGYQDRYNLLIERIRELYHINNEAWQHLRIIPMVICNNLEELLACDAKWLEMGYEGTCIRRLNGKHKQGRSTVREMGLLRIKRFVESEALVMGIEEGETNLNEAQINELGKTFRTSHKDNKVPNGMIGNIQCRAMQNIKDTHSGKLLIEEGQVIKVSPGNMIHELRKYFFENQGEIIGKVIKYKFFPKGIKDEPRFPTFQTFRIESDL